MLLRPAALLAAALSLLLAVAAGAQEQAPPGEAADPVLADFHLANGLLNRGLHDLAADAYRKFLEAHAQHEKAQVARYGLGVCLTRLGKPREAVEQFAALRGVRDFPFAAEAAVLHGQALLALERFDDAAAVLSDAAEKHANHDLADDAAAAWVEAAVRGGAAKAARAAAARFHERWPQSPHLPRVEFFEASAELADGEYAAAAARFTRVAAAAPEGPLAPAAEFQAAQAAQRAGDRTAAERGFRAVLQRANSPHRADAQYGLATVQAAAGRHDEAATLLDQYLTDAPDAPTAPAARLARAHAAFALEDWSRAAVLFEQCAQADGAEAAVAAYWAAKSVLRSGDAATAAARFEAARQRYPQSPLAAESAYDRGVALLRAQQREAAAAAFRAFVDAYPNHALRGDALATLASCELNLERPKAAIEHCSAFLAGSADHPQSPAVRRLLADSLYADGQFADAAPAYAQVAQRAADPAAARAARTRQALALFQCEKFDEAAPLLRELAAAGDAAPERRNVSLALGEIAFRRGEWKTAEEQLATAVSLAERGADEAATLLKLGIARQRQQRHAEALAALDRLLETSAPDALRVQALFERGQALVALKRDAEAQTAFEQVLAVAADGEYRVHALNHLAAIAHRGGDVALAARRFSEVQAAAGDSPLASDALLQQGLALHAAGRDAEAVEALLRFLEHSPQDARGPLARACAGVCLYRLGRHDEALRLLDRLDAADLSRLDASLRDAAGFARGECLLATQRPADAATLFRELAGRDGPFRAHAALRVAEQEMSAKRWAAAADALRPLVAAPDGLPPDVLSAVRYRLGVCAFEQGEADQAVSVLEALLAAAPDGDLAASASHYAGEAHLRAGRAGRAAEHFERAAAIYGRAPQGGAALLRLAECLNTLQHWPRAEAVFSEFLERFGDSADAYQARFGVGWARENQSRHLEAIESYRHVVERHQGPTAARAQFQIGECLFALKRHEDAVRELLKVDILFAYPEWSAAALYEAGRCFEALNKTAEAREQFRRVVEKHGQTRWAQLAAERLAARDPQPPGR